MSFLKPPDTVRTVNLPHPTPFAHAIAKMVAAFKREGWLPKELHLSNDDWWELRDELRDTVNVPTVPMYFDGNRLAMVFCDVRIVTNHLFERGNYRFDPIAPTSVGARVMGDLEEFRSGIKRS